LSEYYVAWWNVENLHDVMPWDQRARKVHASSNSKSSPNRMFRLKYVYRQSLNPF